MILKTFQLSGIGAGGNPLRCQRWWGVEQVVSWAGCGIDGALPPLE